MECFKYTIPLSHHVLQILYFSANLTLALLSLFGNGIVMYIVWFKAQLHTPTYCLMSALALSDFLTTICGQLTYCVEVTFKQWTSCNHDKLIAFFNASSCSSSLLLLCLIARDRYLHVSKGAQYSNHTSNKFAAAASVLCYVTGMLIACLFTIENRLVKVASNVTFAFMASSCFAFITIRSKQIYTIVQSHVKQMQATLEDGVPSCEHGPNEALVNMEKVVNRSLFYVIILFFCSWSPVIILMSIFTVHNLSGTRISEHYRIAFAWGSLVSYFNGAMNPLIYAYRCDAIGCEIRKTISKFSCRRNRIKAPVDIAGQLQPTTITT